jgi:hypothetical protein
MRCPDKMRCPAQLLSKPRFRARGSASRGTLEKGSSLQLLIPYSAFLIYSLTNAHNIKKHTAFHHAAA